MRLPRIELEPAAWRSARRAFAGSRLLVLAAAAFGAVLFPFGETAASVHPNFTHPFDGWPLEDLFQFLVTPFVRWDAVWYLQIAETGYDPTDVGGVAAAGRPAFFPVYPVAVGVLGGSTGPAAGALAACAVSLAALLGALYLLHRLTALELGERAAAATVALVAFAPVAYFFSAPYTESLFLLESVGAVYAARRGNWAAAGVLAALASATRNVGVMLVLPLALLYLMRRRRPGPDFLWIGLAPAGLLAYMVYLHDAVGDAHAWRHAEVFFGRPEVVNPLEGIRRGLAAAVDAFQGVPPDELRFPMVLSFVILLLAGAALVGVFRNLPLAYGVYSLGLLVPALCAPYIESPLAGYPRYALVAFPLFMWLGAACERRRVTQPVLIASAATLAVLTAGFATWQHLG